MIICSGTNDTIKPEWCNVSEPEKGEIKVCYYCLVHGDENAAKEFKEHFNNMINSYLNDLIENVKRSYNYEYNNKG